MHTIHILVSRYDEEKRRFDTKLQVRWVTNLSLYCARFQNACHLLAYKGDIFNLARCHSFKLRANAMDLSTVQAVNLLSSKSWAHLNTLLRGVERCWVLLIQNLKLVKLLAQHDSTFSHFPCLAVIHAWLNKVECICTATLNMLSPRTRQCPAYPKILSHDSTWAFVKSSDCSTC